MSTLITLSGISGIGKSTLCKSAESSAPGRIKYVSAGTRRAWLKASERVKSWSNPRELVSCLSKCDNGNKDMFAEYLVRSVHAYKSAVHEFESLIRKECWDTLRDAAGVADVIISDRLFDYLAYYLWMLYYADGVSRLYVRSKYPDLDDLVKSCFMDSSGHYIVFDGTDFDSFCKSQLSSGISELLEVYERVVVVFLSYKPDVGHYWLPDEPGWHISVSELMHLDDDLRIHLDYLRYPYDINELMMYVYDKLLDSVIDNDRVFVYVRSHNTIDADSIPMLAVSS